MVAGGFTMSHANHFPTNDRLKYMGLAGAGILTSVMSFMFGIAAWA
ncbi:MAG: hypothetical protein LBP82_02280 [Candidatus Methanoplasma sp.]|nr:hypothetical protein [Candidatus Methanoplasma sp.]